MSSRKQKYALEPKPLGSGGQADVFKARDKRTGQIVALEKITSKLDDPIARMRREIEVQTDVKHPNVMPVLDHSSAFYWYTMPLAEAVVGKLPTPITDEMLAQIINDCAQGLMAAHKQGYIHRDLTPNNILLIETDGKRRWVAADWGLVRRYGQTTVVRTAPEQSFGTIGYGAPELWEDAHKADARADIYSLGRVVAWALTGERPKPNIPLIPCGKWAQFVKATTTLDIEQRTQDLSEMLQLLNLIKSH